MPTECPHFRLGVVCTTEAPPGPQIEEPAQGLFHDGNGLPQWALMQWTHTGLKAGTVGSMHWAHCGPLMGIVGTECWHSWGQQQAPL